jgi:hypothetical protein
MCPSPAQTEGEGGVQARMGTAGRAALFGKAQAGMCVSVRVRACVCVCVHAYRRACVCMCMCMCVHA